MTESKQKKHGGRKALKIIAWILIVLIALYGAAVLVNYIGNKSHENYIKSIEKVDYENQLKPVMKNGYQTFVSDHGFKVMQLNDIHIGAGFLSEKKDNMAIDAVAAMVRAEKPDLVIVAGDLTFAVPYSSGTVNNRAGVRLVAMLFEQLGVYWAPVMGNHDSEKYSYFSREYIGNMLESDEYPHCLFKSGNKDVDGVGNYVINLQNDIGRTLESFILLDSHDYLGDDPVGIRWHYDTIHKNQVTWYENQIDNLTKLNGGITPDSMAFFHMPLQEYRQAYEEYRDNGFKNTKNVKYYFGKAGEKDLVVYCSDKNYGFYDAVKKKGSTSALFCGHDHLNNFSMSYKGIRLTYGFTIDYLAYSKIAHFGAQRGCTIIKFDKEGNYKINQENYYQSKYRPQNGKEKVTMNDYYADNGWKK